MMYANPNEVQQKQMKCKTDILRRILENAQNSEINSRKTRRKFLTHTGTCEESSHQMNKNI